MGEKKLFNNYFFKKKNNLIAGLFFVFLFLLTMACGICTAIFTNKTEYCSTGEIYIRKVAEYQLVITLKDYFYDNGLLNTCCDELKNKNILNENGEQYTLTDLKQNVRANTLMSDYKIIVSFRSGSQKNIKETMTVILETGADYLRKKESHYNNNIEKVIVLDNVENVPNHFYYKIVQTFFLSISLAAIGCLFSKHILLK